MIEAGCAATTAYCSGNATRLPYPTGKEEEEKGKD